MAEAPYQPFTQVRGESRQQDKDLDYELLAREMSKQGASPYEFGQFYLLQGKFPEAVAQLGIAEREAGSLAGPHNDLGVAYMEWGGSANFAQAEQEFRHALEKQRGFAPAVFNLAVLAERTGKKADAEQLRQLYLQLDTDSGWAQEIRARFQQ
jgi:Flp pilus assembly protein TadD